GSAFNGWTGQVKGGRKPAWMASFGSRLCRKLGPRDEEIAAMERPKGAFVTTKARRFGAPSPLKRGDQLKAHLARRREDESAWLFEI
ncbi:MAG TPA: hypothetical protein VN838_00810, partial [Bradyrhizobium sp.]|nr:hypothetical protein [Bradyrhizobium sp.]